MLPGEIIIKQPYKIDLDNKYFQPRFKTCALRDKTNVVSFSFFFLFFSSQNFSYNTITESPSRTSECSIGTDTFVFMPPHLCHYLFSSLEEA